MRGKCSYLSLVANHPTVSTWLALSLPWLQLPGHTGSSMVARKTKAHSIANQGMSGRIAGNVPGNQHEWGIRGRWKA